MLENLQHSLEAFRAFLNHTQEMTQKVKKDYLDFIRYMTPLVKASSLGHNLKEEIYMKAVKSNSFASKPWLIGKMEEALR
ncbi:MAG: hypothetical protein N2510_01940 [Ignavibacteria bacterium]|nr:hypothetical protein [Ignavibacteria bacterium]